MPNDLHHIFPWDEGRNYSYGWHVMVILLTIGVLFNLIQLAVHYLIPKLRQLPNAPTILFLAVQDLTFDTLCLITCSSSLNHQAFYGREFMCYFQGFYGEFLMTLSGLSICSLVYAPYSSIVFGKSISEREVFRIQVVISSYCLLLSFLGVVYPGKPTLNPSGLFCYTSSQFLPEALTFFVGYCLPTFSGLLYMNWQLGLGIQKMKARLEEQGLPGRPRPAAIQNLRSMWIYVMVMIFCYVPIIGVYMYSWVTGFLSPPWLWIVFAFTAHLNTVINPCLYYLLSTPARKLVISAVISGLNRLGYTIAQDEPDTDYYGDIHQKYFNSFIETVAGRKTLHDLAVDRLCPEVTHFLFYAYPFWLREANQLNAKYRELTGLDSVSAFKSAAIPALRHSVVTPESAIRHMNSSNDDKQEETSFIIPVLDSQFSLEIVSPNAEVTVTSPPSQYRDLGMPTLELTSLSTSYPNQELITTLTQLNQHAANIYATYVSELAPYLVNISDELRTEIKEEVFSDPNPEMHTVRDTLAAQGVPSFINLSNPVAIFESLAVTARSLIYDGVFQLHLRSEAASKIIGDHNRLDILDTSGVLG